MDLWVGRAKKASICHYCDGLIRKDEAVMQGRARKRKGLRWPPTIRWHPDCWLASCRDYLGVQPSSRVVAGSLGRPKTADPATGRPLAEEARRTRARIVHRFNVLVSRRRLLLEQITKSSCLDHQKLHHLAVLTDRMRRCAGEVEGFGGVPASWLGILGLRAEAGNGRAGEVYEAGAAQV